MIVMYFENSFIKKLETTSLDLIKKVVSKLDGELILTKIKTFTKAQTLLQKL